MKWPTWLNPANWFKRDLTIEQLVKLGFVGQPVAGVHLTETTALGVGAVYCADRVISEDLASLPMLVYAGNRLDDGAKPLLDDPITKLLARPNPVQTGPVFWSAWQHNANIHGFGLAEIVRNGAGQAVELWPIPSPLVRTGQDAAGRPTFEADGLTGGSVVLGLDEVLFLPGFSPDGSIGFKLLSIAKQILGSAIASQTFMASRFEKGLAPCGAIKHPGVLSDPARENMRLSWARSYGGPGNAGAPLILEEGTGWEKLDIAHADQVQLTQVSEWLVSEVARFFNVSPVKLHQLGRATWGNLETLNRDHVITSLGPWISKRDAEIDLKLLGPGRHCRHVVDRLLTADTSTRFEAWGKALAAGWMTPNEIRRREDLPPLPGGDDLHRPLNQGPAGDGAAKPPTEAPPNGTDRADPPQSGQ
jgi:HK97 family phage portal protein